MFTASKDISDHAHLEADLVIVGSGAAGITIARHFATKSKRVIVLEGGGEQFDDTVQSLYRGTRTGVIADPPLDASRLRFFGGTTNHWTGWCRPLERWDFDKRPDWPESGWPITRADLDPFYKKAEAICRLGAGSFDDVQSWQHRSGGQKIKFLPLDAERFYSAIFQVSNAPLFARLYGPELKAAKNINILLDANALEILPAPGHHADQERKRVGAVHVRTLSGKSFTVSGRAVVIATGGIESARLLLLSDKIHPKGAGNEHDLVGRYFMDHVWLNANCYLHFSRPGLDLPVYFDQLPVGDAQMFATIAANRKLLERERIGAFRLWLKPSNVSTAGMDAAHNLAGDLAHGRMPNDFMSDLGDMLADIDVLSDAAYKTLFHTNNGFLTTDPNGPNRGAWIDINFEQRPNWNSRVMLGEDRDVFGQRRVKLDWRLSETDRRTATRGLELAADEFGRLGIGRSRINFDLNNGASWPSNMVSSCHHSGSARMADRPERGVVDAHCRVHSVDNLYVAGSAVFPTAGYANPTLTIVALAQRLAEHLEGILI